MFWSLLIAVIELTGVSGNTLRSRAFFDAHNVKVGDPLILTIDFIGEAEFKELHPPAISKAVKSGDWKVDDASAKTDTYSAARRITYRVRPMREGVVYFPSLEFSYDGPEGEKRIVKTNVIPVHAKRGVDVVVEGMDEDFDAMPSPAELIVELGKKPWGVRVEDLSDDELFAWKKACATPRADAFAAFDFPEAKLNEARCALVVGEWSRALKVLRALEWRTGQTEEIEKGIVSALAMRYQNPAVELPVWRQVLRPLLRYAWAARVGIVLSIILLFAFASWLFGKVLRKFASVAFLALLLLPCNAEAQDIFEHLNRQMRKMEERMNRMVRGSFTGLAEDDKTVISIDATAKMSTENPVVGEEFEFFISIKTLSNITLSNIRLVPSETVGLKVLGPVRNLPDEKAGPSNVVKRLSVPVRYDVPLKTDISFEIEGMAEGQAKHIQMGVMFSYSKSFHAKTPPIKLNVRPLPGDGQPEDFAGIVSESLRLIEMCDITKVETNDIVCITYSLNYNNGIVPLDFMPPGSAFEMGRNSKHGLVQYRRFFVADGAKQTPIISIPYYDPRTKTYKRVSAGGTELLYIK